MGEPKVVFVRVKEGARELPCWDVELRRSDELTFEGLLKATLRTHSKDVVRLAEREVTVKMAPKADERGAVCITSAAVTVWSRLGAGNFIFFNVGPLPTEPKLSEEEKETKRREGAERSLSLLMAGGRGLDSLPEKNDASKSQRPESMIFNALVDHCEANGLRFPKCEVGKPLPQLVVHPEAHGDRG